MDDVDSEQWEVISKGKTGQRVRNKICGLRWDVPTENLDKFFTLLDQTQVTSVLTSTCQCHIACGSRFNFAQLLQARFDVLGDLDSHREVWDPSSNHQRNWTSNLSRNWEIHPSQVQYLWIGSVPKILSSGACHFLPHKPQDSQSGDRGREPFPTSSSE